jgi:hypothetical protein
VGGSDRLYFRESPQGEPDELRQPLRGASVVAAADGLAEVVTFVAKAAPRAGRGKLLRVHEEAARDRQPREHDEEWDPRVLTHASLIGEDAPGFRPVRVICGVLAPKKSRSETGELH